MASAKALASIDDVLLRGQVFGQTGNLTVDDFESPSDLTVSSFDSTGDIRGFLRGGYWVDLGGVDRVKSVENFAGFILANAIYHMWRRQEVNILGVPKCDEADTK